MPGTLSLTVISHDWTSNTVQVELVGEPPPSPSEPDEVNPAPDSDLGLPSYVKTHNSPSAPKQGVAFAIDVKPGGRAGMIAQGAFSTVARSVHLPQERQAHQYADGQQRTVAAVVRVSLLLLRLNGEWPYLFNWTLPVYSAKKISPGDRLEGHFTIDLLQGRAGVPAVGDYVAYALMEARIFGPVKFKWE